MKSTNDSTPAIVGALAIAIIISAAAYVVTQSGSNSTTSVAANTQTATKETTSQTTDAATSTANSSQAADTTTTTNNTSSTGGYNDGTYAASADYSVPHGSNSISATITVKNGLVSSVKTTHDYADHESGMYVDSFDSSIQSSVVGKSISSLTSLSRVGGASLTTYGFEDALATIASQAKA